MCGSLEIDSAIDTVRALANEMAEAKREAQQGKLLPLPGETVENCALELGATSKTVGSSMAQLLTAANQGVCVCVCGGGVCVCACVCVCVCGWVLAI